MKNPTIVISVINQKGGVGKTITAVTLATGLARQYGQRVLLIDLDAQGNCADCLGIDAGPDLSVWLDNNKFMPQPIYDIDLIRSERLTTSRLVKRLAMEPAGVFILKDALDDLDKAYDIVLFDCPPADDGLSSAAIVASNFLLIPTTLETTSVKGVTEVFDRLKALRRLANLTTVLGIIPTQHERVTNHTRIQLENLVGSPLGKLLFPPVPKDIKVDEAKTSGRPLWIYAPQARATLGYNNVLTRLVLDAGVNVSL
ncbi:MAG TPA: ParA family protein [Anaerolineaceae bacterium]|nr:ParA family protein [Anaerolineaceae bacterium]HPN52993.1 ParA family protein [Anaerolineaceae bacterium]